MRIPFRKIKLGKFKDVTERETLKAGLGEFIGTFILVFAGSGSAVTINKITGNGGATLESLTTAAFAHAFALFVAVSVSTSDCSVGNVNPAVTFGLFIVGEISFLHSLVYFIAQLLGSISACFLLLIVSGGQGIPVFGLSSGVGVGNALVLEIVMTFGLVYTVYATTIGTNKDSLGTIAPIAIGFIVGANILAFGVFDGASMNPAASLGPAIVSWTWANHWVYWVGPLIGGGLAGLIYELSVVHY